VAGSNLKKKGAIKFKAKEKKGLLGSGPLSLASYIILILCIPLFFLSLFLPWGGIEGDGKLGGIQAEAEVEFYPYKAEYQAHADTRTLKNSTGFQLAQGLASGVTVPGQDTTQLGRNIPDERNVSGEFNYITQDRSRMSGDFGMLYDSYNNKSYDYILVPWMGDNVFVKVKTMAKMVPWWVMGSNNDITIQLYINNITEEDFQEVRVKSARIEVWVDFDEKIQKFGRVGYKVEIPEATNKVIKKQADGEYNVLEFVKSINFGSDKFEEYERVGIVGRVELTMLDSKGEAEADTLEPATDEYPPSTINIMLMPMADAGRVAGFFSVILLLPVAMILGLVSGVLSIFQKRVAIGFAIASGLVFLLAPLLFYLGINTLSELIIFDNDISYSIGFFIPFLLGPGAIAAGILMYLNIPKSKKKKDAAVIVVDDEDTGEEVTKKQGKKNRSKNKAAEKKGKRKGK
jgi:hypothetical protein